MFSLIESLVPTASRPSPTLEDLALTSPAPPRVRRLDDGAIEIRHDFFRRSTIRLGDEDAERALLECLTQGFEQSFGNDIGEWDQRYVRSETKRVMDECLGAHGMLPPRPSVPPKTPADRESG